MGIGARCEYVGVDTRGRTVTPTKAPRPIVGSTYFDWAPKSHRTHSE